MDDRTLLELAAKAAGIALTWQPGWGGMPDWALWQGVNWNPLTDDGDALRLAVKLRIDIGFYGLNGMFAQSERRIPDSPGSSLEFDNGADDYAVTRRAIVNAAAEIGKDTP